MITAKIESQVRTLKVACENNQDSAISALQGSVKNLTKEDGRCKFIVLKNGVEVYSWFYQPTIREEKQVTPKKKESKYEYGCSVYVLLNGCELNYNNFYHNEFFDSVAEAREYMKQDGWGSFDYRIVYEYIVTDLEGNSIYGTGLGFTKAEAKEELNKSLAYYNLELKNGYIKES